MFFFLLQHNALAAIFKLTRNDNNINNIGCVSSE